MFPRTTRRAVLPSVSIMILSSVLLLSYFAYAQGEVRLQFAGRYVAGSHEEANRAFMQAIDAYKDVRPEVEIEYVGEGDHTEYLEKLLVMGAAVGFPDIMHLYNPWIPDFMFKGMRFDSVPMQIEQKLRKGAFPAALDLTTYEEQLIGIPSENQIGALLWNKQIFAEAGIADLPDTWQELEQMARWLTKIEPDGAVQQMGFVVENWDWAVQFLAMLHSEGGGYLDQTGRVAFADSTGLRTLQRLVEWRNDLGLFSTDTGLFPQKRAALALVFPWAKFGLAAAFGQDITAGIGVGSVPSGAACRAAYHYGWGMYVPTSSKALDEAWRFLDFLTFDYQDRDITYLGQALAAIGSLPTLRRDIQSSHYRTDFEFYNAFIGNLNYAMTEPQLPDSQRRMTILTGELNAALERRKSPVQALNDAQIQIEAVVDQYR